MRTIVKPLSSKGAKLVKRVSGGDFAGRLLVIHPGFVPQEMAVAERITLHEGASVGVPEAVRRPGAALRVYAMDWIGRFDVETLPPVKSDAVLRCGAAGTVFDSSWTRKSPATFGIGTGNVIPGWDKGLVGKKVGSRVLLVVPPADGYGDRAQAKIPANSTLVFVVDILDAS